MLPAIANVENYYWRRYKLKLTAAITKTLAGDQIIGIDRQIPSRAELPLPFLVEDTPSPGYADISSIVNWYKYGLEGSYLNQDYLYYRDRVKDLVIQKTIDACLGELADPSTVTPQVGDRYCVSSGAVGEFAGKDGLTAEYTATGWIFHDKEFLGYQLCSETEKRIAMELYVGSPADHDLDFGAAEAQHWREEYHETATPVREKRIKRTETLIESQLRPYQSVIMLIITSLVTDLDIGFGPQSFSIDLHKNYWRFGVKGTVEDYHGIKNPTPGIGLMDYVYGRSLFTGKGLIDMPWTPDTMTMTEVCARINEILVVGN